MSLGFDPSTLVPVAESMARAALPTLSTILGAAVPFPFSLFVGPAFAAIAAALGDDPATATPATVKARIDADPAAAAAAEAAQQELDARLHDVQDARATGVQYIKSGSPMEWAPAIVSAITVAGFFVICAIMLFHIGDQSIAQGILGALTAGWTTVLTYWCGSSKGSSDKTAALTALASQPQVIQGPGSHVSGGIAPKRAGR